MSSWLPVTCAALLLGVAIAALSHQEEGVADQQETVLPRRSVREARGTIEKAAAADEVTASGIGLTTRSDQPGPSAPASAPIRTDSELKRESRRRPPVASGTTFHQPLLFALADEELILRIPELSVEGIETLRDQFVEEAGVDVLDPADPEYASRWGRAEATLEERLRSLYGWGAWAAYQRQRAVQAYAENRAR